MFHFCVLSFARAQPEQTIAAAVVSLFEGVKTTTLVGKVVSVWLGGIARFLPNPTTTVKKLDTLPCWWVAHGLRTLTGAARQWRAYSLPTAKPDWSRDRSVLCFSSRRLWCVWSRIFHCICGAGCTERNYLHFNSHSKGMTKLLSTRHIVFFS